MHRIYNLLYHEVETNNLRHILYQFELFLCNIPKSQMRVVIIAYSPYIVTKKIIFWNLFIYLPCIFICRDYKLFNDIYGKSYRIILDFLWG